MSSGHRILIVDDDDMLRHPWPNNWSCTRNSPSARRATAAKALDLAKTQRFDAVLLDVGLPDMDGRELCRLMRRNGVRAPILMLTAADGDADTILGLDSGANDYITKPFRLNVLLARLRAQLRQHEALGGRGLHHRALHFPAERQAADRRRRQRKMRLTEKETAILKYLYRAGDRIIGRDTLLNEVWGYNAGVTTHTLETHVYRLRQKIERDPAKAEILVTDAGGYRLVP